MQPTMEQLNTAYDAFMSKLKGTDASHGLDAQEAPSVESVAGAVEATATAPTEPASTPPNESTDASKTGAAIITAPPPAASESPMLIVPAAEQQAKPAPSCIAATPLPLSEQVRAAITTYALEEGRLAAIFAAHALPWDEATGRKVVDTAARQIGASVESRGETAYALDGNATRIASVKKYLDKLVAKRAEKAKK